jgi:hypothetical protein
MPGFRLQAVAAATPGPRSPNVTCKPGVVTGFARAAMKPQVTVAKNQGTLLRRKPYEKSPIIFAIWKISSGVSTLTSFPSGPQLKLFYGRLS